MATTTDEAAIRARVASADYDGATELAIRAYGSEIIAWLCSVLPSADDAHDAFSWLSEELWRSVRRYDGRCAIRTWCYMLARHAASRIFEKPHRSREELVASLPSVRHAVDHVWNTSRANAQQVQDVYAEIRATLSVDDQLLLVLRVDRELAWRDIAIVLLGQDDPADDEVTRKAAACRKQFERVKEQLRKLAAERLH